VALDVSAVPVAPVGAGRYVIELARALGAIPACELGLVSRRDDAERWRRFAPHADVLAAAPPRLAARVAWGELALGAALAHLAHPPVVLHGPHYTLPLRSPCATVVTVHDLTLVDHPEWHERAKVVYFTRALRRAARADVVVCVSQPTADRFRERLAPDVPVVVVPHGVDHARFHPARDEGEAAADGEVLARLGVHPPYVLHVGTIEPRKDLGRLVAAFDVLATGHRELTLVLAGRVGWRAEGFEASLAAAHHAERVRRLGYVADDDLPALVRHAAAVAYPSLEEGFGLPALEALACGSPLVTTEGSVMASLAGDAARCALPGDPAALAEALEEALAGGQEGARRRALGLEAAARHTWARSAAAHLAAYRLAAGR
jgi:glycosyltransferase involved in cell wall biosynthesis